MVPSRSFLSHFAEACLAKSPEDWPSVGSTFGIARARIAKTDGRRTVFMGLLRFLELPTNITIQCLGPFFLPESVLRVLTLVQEHRPKRHRANGWPNRIRSAR